MLEMPRPLSYAAWALSAFLKSRIKLILEKISNVPIRTIVKRNLTISTFLPIAKYRTNVFEQIFVKFESFGKEKGKTCDLLLQVILRAVVVAQRSGRAYAS